MEIRKVRLLTSNIFTGRTTLQAEDYTLSWLQDQSHSPKLHPKVTDSISSLSPSSSKQYTVMGESAANYGQPSSQDYYSESVGLRIIIPHEDPVEMSPLI